jgi:hypothetical protein
MQIVCLIVILKAKIDSASGQTKQYICTIIYLYLTKIKQLYPMQGATLPIYSHETTQIIYF